MGEAGILGEDDRVELINGEIVRMNPIGSPHAGCVNRLNALLSRHFAGQAVVQIQNPVRASDLSEPQPDLGLLRFRSDYYAERHPRPSDVLLLIEVSDSSVAYDRSVKAALVLNIEPIDSMILGYLILGQALTPLQMIGAALVIGAITLGRAPRAAQLSKPAT